MTWEDLPVETNPDAVTDRILDGLVATIPGLVLSEGDPLVALSEEIGRETAITSARMQDSVRLAVAGIGATVFGVQPELGQFATLVADVETTPGATIPAGWQVIADNPDGRPFTFSVGDSVTTDATITSVVFTAVELGQAANGVAIGATLTPVTATLGVVAATVTVASTGGADPESMPDYLDRLLNHIATLRFGGVRAADMAALARSVPGVDRALGIDLYDPAQPGVVVERTVTVVPIDVDNQPVSPQIGDAVQAKLEAAREVNFIIHVAEPTYTPVHITYTAVTETNVSLIETEARINEALTEYLTNWGRSPTDAHAWVSEPTVRFFDVARIAGSAEGVAYLSSITINGATDDVILTGVAALPKPLVGPDPSTITGSVT